MTFAAPIPELIAEPAVADWIAARCVSRWGLTALERAAISGAIEEELTSEPWQAFRETRLGTVGVA